MTQERNKEHPLMEEPLDGHNVFSPTGPELVTHSKDKSLDFGDNEREAGEHPENGLSAPEDGQNMEEAEKETTHKAHKMAVIDYLTGWGGRMRTTLGMQRIRQFMLPIQNSESHLPNDLVIAAALIGHKPAHSPLDWERFLDMDVVKIIQCPTLRSLVNWNLTVCHRIYQCLTILATYIQKFRTAVLVVQVIRNLIKIYRDYAASRTEPISFGEYIGFQAESENLLFDRSLFKAKAEMVLSAEAKQILSSPPKKRTSEDIKLAMLSLRMTVSIFAAYPVHIQEKIATVSWYECFGPGRVIIRQGHVPQNFYLILSGTAVVTKVSRAKHSGELFSKTVAFLKKGKYFGDVAILTNAKRNATVVCHDTVSLLAISRQDFLNIFLSLEEGPEHIQLLHSIELLRGWPVHKLPYNNPRICTHTFYRPGTVITKDSKASSKIYVIKSGSVRVLKAMPIQRTPSSTNAKLQMKNTTMEKSRNGSSGQFSGPGCDSKPNIWASSSLAYSCAGGLQMPNDVGRLACQQLHLMQKLPKNKVQGEPQCTLTEEERLLPLLQRDRKWNETAVTDLPINKSDTCAAQPVTDGNVPQILIHIQTLRAGEVFGLAYTIFEDTLGMALVSDGAECIVISKEFFKKQMDDAYLHKLSRHIQPYPTKKMLQQKIRDYMRWQAYKSQLTRKQP
ncbi:uncharacterized protein PAF06_005712 [Gastrophryne carolinensis]